MKLKSTVNWVIQCTDAQTGDVPNTSNSRVTLLQELRGVKELLADSGRVRKFTTCKTKGTVLQLVEEEDGDRSGLAPRA